MKSGLAERAVGREFSGSEEAKAVRGKSTVHVWAGHRVTA